MILFFAVLLFVGAFFLGQDEDFSWRPAIYALMLAVLLFGFYLGSL